MHYPPLADGTYRYGDPPQPLPSPVPGPDPGAQPWAAAAAPPHTAPPPGSHHAEPPPGSHRSDGAAPERSQGAHAAIVAGSVFGVVAVVALGLAVFSPDSDRDQAATGRWPSFPTGAPEPAPGPAPGASAFPVRGTFAVTSSPSEPVSGDAERCTLPTTLSDIGEGTTIRLLDPTRAPIDDAMLAYAGGDATSCTYSFDFDRVPAGDSFYVLEIPGRGQLVYTERELREGVDITLGR